MKLTWRAMIALGSMLLLLSIGGFSLTYSYLEKNKTTVQMGRSLLFPAPYDFSFLSSPELRTIAYFFISAVILLTGLFLTTILGLILLVMGFRKRESAPDGI